MADFEKVESKSDTIVRVDRSICLNYPRWIRDVLHPEFATFGPAEYDLAKQVELWLHDDQKNGGMKGKCVYKHLKQTDTLKRCLGLHDALAIQQAGIVVFRELFGNNTVSCWKSVAHRADGCLEVPCLFATGKKVLVLWDRVDGRWSDRHPAARFVS
jgi:hypothetical protein